MTNFINPKLELAVYIQKLKLHGMKIINEFSSSHFIFSYSGIHLSLFTSHIFYP